MDDMSSLISKVGSAPVYESEMYVMNYLLPFTRQSIYDIEHPLNRQYHVPINEAFFRLQRPEELANLIKLLNCAQANVFERLRDLFDEWDGVRLPEPSESPDVTEQDAYKLFMEDEALEIAARIIGSHPSGVLGYLFDPEKMYEDINSVSTGSRLAMGDIYKLLRYTSSVSDVREKIKINLDRRDWWEILEHWVKGSVRGSIASILSEKTGHEVPKSRVLRELFKLVKQQLPHSEKRSAGHRSSQDIRLILPVQTIEFWEKLKQASSEQTATTNLDPLEDVNLKKNNAEINAENAVRLAQEFIKSNVQPMDSQLSRVDVFGMLALKHRFQGILDELLSNALHYATLDSGTNTPLGYFQDAIRFYCHGEYKIALNDLLKVEHITLESLNIEYKTPAILPNLEKDLNLIAFSEEDNPRLNLVSFIRSGDIPRPPRTVRPGELLIAAQEDSRYVEVLALNNLNQDQLTEIKNSLPKSVAIPQSNSSIADLILRLPLAVNLKRRQLNEALAQVIEQITHCVVLNALPLTIERFIPSANVFGKLPKAINTEHTVSQRYSLEAMKDDMKSKYQQKNINVTIVSGS